MRKSGDMSECDLSGGAAKMNPADAFAKMSVGTGRPSFMLALFARPSQDSIDSSLLRANVCESVGEVMGKEKIRNRFLSYLEHTHDFGGGDVEQPTNIEGYIFVGDRENPKQNSFFNWYCRVPGSKYNEPSSFDISEKNYGYTGFLEGDIIDLIADYERTFPEAVIDLSKPPASVDVVSVPEELTS